MKDGILYKMPYAVLINIACYSFRPLKANQLCGPICTEHGYKYK